MKKLITLLLTTTITLTLLIPAGCNKKGELLNLREAYDNGDLTEEDLLSIAYYNQRTRYNEELMGEDYSPQPKDPETLDEKTEKKIVKALKKYVKKECSEHITILNYLGTYNNCIIIEYRDGRTFTSVEKETFVTIGGVEFSFWWPSTIEMLVIYKTGK